MRLPRLIAAASQRLSLRSVAASVAAVWRLRSGYLLYLG
jgi:hypothetical protein